MRHLLKCFGSCMTVVHSWLATEVHVLLMDVHIRTADITSAIINWWSCTFYLFFHVVKPTRSITKSYNSTVLVILNVKVFLCLYSEHVVICSSLQLWWWDFWPDVLSGSTTQHLVRQPDIWLYYYQYQYYYYCAPFFCVLLLLKLLLLLSNALELHVDTNIMSC